MVNKGENNPAAQILLSDLVENILKYSDNPGACAEYVTAQIRELIGVRIVALTERISDKTGTSHKLIGICPPRKESDWNSPELTEFLSMASQFETPGLIDPELDHGARFLPVLGKGKSFIVPLLTGSEKVGMTVLIGLMDPAGVKDILATLTRISGVIALIMRNALLYRKMEFLVETRTQELREREKFFRAMFEQAGVGVAQLNAMTGKFVQVNHKFADILGYSPNELKEVNYQTITHPEDLPKDRESIALLKSGSVNEITHETRYYHKTGSLIWINLTLSSLREKGSPNDYYVAIAQDISEAKKAEEALQNREEFLSSIIENIPNMIFIKEAKDLTFVRFNKAGEKLLGLRRDELIGKSDLDFFSPKQAQFFIEKDRKVLSSGKMIDIPEESISTKNGERTLHTKKIPIFDINGKPAYLLGISEDITERKQAEEALVAAERRMARCLANMPGFAYTFRGTQEGHFSFPYASPGIEKLYGLKPEDVLEDMSPIHQLAHPEDQPRIEGSIAESARTMTLFESEFRICRPNSLDCWIQSIAMPNRDDDGSILWHGIMLDITERKQAEAEIHRLVDLQSAILNNAAYMVISSDTKGVITLFNPAAEHALGYTTEECVGHLTPNIFHDQDEVIERARMLSTELGITVEPGFEVFVAKARLNMPNEYEWILIAKDGSHFPVLLSVTALRDSQGNIDGFLGIANNISDRKQAEESLQKSEAKYRTLFENLNEGFALHEIIVDERDIPIDYKFLEMNPLFETMTGLERAKVIGKTARMILPGIEIDPINWIGRYGKVALTGVGTNFEHYSNQIGKWYLINAFSPGAGYFATTVMDITDRKQAEAEIHLLNQKLEQRVLERTSQLEAANKELETFAYSVSHDLRAPLRGIDGFSQILIEEYQNQIDKQGQNYLHRVRNASQRMAQLIDDMLKLSRISREELNIHQVNLSKIAKEIADELRDSDLKRSVKFQVQDNIIANADGQLLRIVFENLLGNAWKFTSMHPTACIEFGLLQQEETLVYFVRDDGAGFEMKYAQKLFGAFQRLHSAQNFSGTGIGLATVQRIIHRHGGRVWAEGEVDKGATFYFTIPKEDHYNE